MQILNRFPSETYILSGLEHIKMCVESETIIQKGTVEILQLWIARGVDLGSSPLLEKQNTEWKQSLSYYGLLLPSPKAGGHFSFFVFPKNPFTGITPAILAVTSKKTWTLSHLIICNSQ